MLLSLYCFQKNHNFENLVIPVEKAEAKNIAESAMQKARGHSEVMSVGLGGRETRVWVVPLPPGCGAELPPL